MWDTNKSVYQASNFGYYTAKQFSHATGIKLQALRARLRRGSLKGIKVGVMWFIPKGG